MAVDDILGLADSASIPVAAANEIDAAYCLSFMRQVRDCSFATVDADGLPSVRIIDIMHAEGGRIYFLAPRGKAFHAEIMRLPVVAIVAQTTDFRTCRLRGRVVRPEDSEQHRLVDWMFELNPSMCKLYPGDTRYVCDVFYIEDGSGDYFDLGQKPVVRAQFSIGNGGTEMGGRFEITAWCNGCGICAQACPQGCIEKSGATYEIDQSACLHCGLCFETCPTHAIEKVKV